MPKYFATIATNHGASLVRFIYLAIMVVDRGLGDLELLEAWSAGDRQAGAQLLERHLRAVQDFFRHQVGDRYEDLSQQTFVALIEARDRFHGDSSFRSYLFGIAHNVLRRHYRASGNERRRSTWWAASAGVDVRPGPSTVLNGHEEDDRLRAALRTMPLDCQVVLELYYWEEMSALAIAQVVGTVENTVRNRLRRGRKLLAAELRAEPRLSSPARTRTARTAL